MTSAEGGTIDCVPSGFTPLDLSKAQLYTSVSVMPQEKRISLILMDPEAGDLKLTLVEHMKRMEREEERAGGLIANGIRFVTLFVTLAALEVFLALQFEATHLHLAPLIASSMTIGILGVTFFCKYFVSMKNLRQYEEDYLALHTLMNTGGNVGAASKVLRSSPNGRDPRLSFQDIWQKVTSWDASEEG